MKKILLAATMLMLTFCCFAQIDTIRAEQNFIFQNINKTLISTGYLNEYGPEVVDKTWLTGVLSDSNYIFDIDVFNLLYNDIENSRINTAIPAMKPLDTAQVEVNLARYDSVAILALFSADYSSLREDAIQQHLFTASGNQIYDVVGRPQSPYLLKHCFAAVPVLPQSAFDNEIRLGYQPLFYGNTNRAISTVLVNFLDGTGYHTIFAHGTPMEVTKSYSDSSGYKKFSVKVFYTDGSTDECYTQQMVHVTPVSGMQYRFMPLTTQEFSNPVHVIHPSSYLNVNPFIPLFIPAGSPLYQTQHFRQDMKIYIRYSKLRQGTSLQNKIVKPLIVVEGYDITDASPLLKANNYGLNDLINEWDNPKISSQFDINKKLDEEGGYDLIFIDYYTMRSLIENGDYLLQAIDWINGQKVNNLTGVREQNVVMGISMGGLVSRYALAKRTKQTGTNSTETRQLITMDSPHQGANVPLGLQYFLYDLGEAKIVLSLKSRVDELKAFYDLNAQPATQQQLILRVTDGNGGRVANTFLVPGGPYRTMIDYTAPYQFLAISDGSQCAKPIMDAGALILQRSGTVAIANWVGGYLFRNKYQLSVQINALPAYGTQAQICNVVMKRNIRLFLGAIGTGWHTTSNSSPRISPPNTLPWDGVPGGTQNVERGGSLSQSGTFPSIGKGYSFFGNVWRGIVGSLILNADYNITFPFAQKIFSFVPITSALDVQNVTSTTFNQPFIYHINGLNGSRSNKYVAQEFSNGLYNISHTDFTPRNSKWIYNEMQSITQTYDCNDYCDLSSITINGSNYLCGCNTYTIDGLLTNSTATWSASPSGAVTLTPNGNSVSVCKVTNGNITLTATITGACGNGTIQKQIYVGVPIIYGTYTDNSGSHYLQYWTGGSSSYNSVCNSYNATTNMNIQGASSVTWSKVTSNPSFITWNQSGNDVGFYFWNVNQTAVFKVDAINSCGTANNTFGFKSIDCSGGGGGGCLVYQLSPNPAMSAIQIGVAPNIPAPCDPSPQAQEETSVSKIKPTTDRSIQSVSIYDNKGHLQQQKQYSIGNKQATLNVSNLPAGIYMVRITDGTYTESHRVVIGK